MAFTLQSDFAQVAARLRVAKAKLPEAQKAGMRGVGVQVVSWAILDFRKRGSGAAAGGTRWRPITLAAIATRLAKRSPWRSITDSLHAMTIQEKQLREELAVKMPKAGTAKQRGAIAHAFDEKNPLIVKNRKSRKRLKAKRKGMINKEFANHTIGVDTGRLVNSLVHGEPALAKAGAPRQRLGSPPPKATFRVSSVEVTAASNLEYAKHFDKIRAIYPAQMIDGQRVEELEELLSDVQDEVIRKAIEGGTA